VDTSGFPSIYLTGITPSEIAVLSVQQIKILLPRLILVADQMNTAQLASIYIKVFFNTSDLSHFSPFLTLSLIGVIAIDLFVSARMNCRAAKYSLTESQTNRCESDFERDC